MVQSVICKCSSRFNHKVDSLTASSASLDELLLSISHVSPETCRKFLRVSDLRPEKVLEILLGFELGVKNLLYDARIVGSLWEIFKRAADRNEGFKPLPQSCEVIASMLMGARMLREVESLLSTMETQGVLLACDEICSSLIEGYVHAGELERAILMYDRMRGKGLVPSSSCYCALIDFSLYISGKTTIDYPSFLQYKQTSAAKTHHQSHLSLCCSSSLFSFFVGGGGGVSNFHTFPPFQVEPYYCRAEV